MGAKPLMIQGTMSGVGKSLLVAGLCRVLVQDGVRVAPFKSQNMALNSAITHEGLEIGRAQAMQAEAAGIPATAAMNPILLKPTTDVGSQVIVNGRPVGTMSAREYLGFRHTLKDAIVDAYRELERDFDVVLIEGAGSPVELNLKRDDIVNMGVARMLASPVLLAGDIDRGGVFAQLIGTLMLLENDERKLVKATVVNKFRGDPTLFADGMSILRERTGLPVAGLVPFMRLDLDDEDSVSDRLDARSSTGLVDVAVVRLPKISNFTDFIALDAMDDIGVRYVSKPSDLGRPDLIIIPGTKATMADLLWMRTSGMETAVIRAARTGVAVLGICGGYQMLGQSVEDPSGVEGSGVLVGMGLLPVRTVFGTDKRTMQVMGTFCQVDGPLSALSGASVSGYEIHQGVTERLGGAPFLSVRDKHGASDKAAAGKDATGTPTTGVPATVGDASMIDAAQPSHEDGCQQGNVYGCYLHGLFDDPAANRALLSALLSAKGLDPSGAQSLDMAEYRQRQYDMLADGIRRHMDLDLVYRIIEEGA